MPPPKAGDAGAVDIRALTEAELPTATALLAEGMGDNPVHLRVFGPNASRRRRYLAHFLSPLVAHVHGNGELWGAHVEGELVGVLGMIAPGRCRPGIRDRLTFARAMMPTIPPPVLWRLRRWLAAWARHDPKTPHWHLGPMTVLATHRRRGVARRLMTHCCQRLDALDATGWLETDLEINAAFYRTLGFVTVRQEQILGEPTWFMQRAPDLLRDRADTSARETVDAQFTALKDRYATDGY